MEIKQVTQEMVAALKNPLPAEAIKQHPTKAYLSAIKVPFIIERLNEVFGVAGWKVRNEVVEAGDKMIVVKSTLSVPEYGIEHEAFGGNDNPDRGDAYKGACTDALSKIASYLYIAMDVYKGLGDAPSRAASKKQPTTKPEPVQIKGKVSHMKVEAIVDDEGNDDTEVQVLIGDKVCFAGVEPNRTKLIDLHESQLQAEFVVMPTPRKSAKGAAMFSVHTVSPIPTQVPDASVGAALKQSVAVIKEAEKLADDFLNEETGTAKGLVKNVRRMAGDKAVSVEIVSAHGTVASLSTFSKTLQKRLEDSTNKSVVLRYKRSDDLRYMNITDVERVGEVDFTEAR